MIIVPELCFNILQLKKLLSANSEGSTLYKRGSVRVCARVCNHAFLTVQECTCSCVWLYTPLSRMSLNVYHKCWESYTTRLSVLPNCLLLLGRITGLRLDSGNNVNCVTLSRYSIMRQECNESLQAYFMCKKNGCGNLLNELMEYWRYISSSCSCCGLISYMSAASSNSTVAFCKR